MHEILEMIYYLLEINLLNKTWFVAYLKKNV